MQTVISNDNIIHKEARDSARGGFLSVLSKLFEEKTKTILKMIGSRHLEESDSLWIGFFCVAAQSLTERNPSEGSEPSEGFVCATHNYAITFYRK